MENMDNRMRTDTFAADEVRSLDLRIAAANVRTREAAGREIRVAAFRKACHCLQGERDREPAAVGR